MGAINESKKPLVFSIQKIFQVKPGDASWVIDETISSVVNDATSWVRDRCSKIKIVRDKSYWREKINDIEVDLNGTVTRLGEGHYEKFYFSLNASALEKSPDMKERALLVGRYSIKGGWHGYFHCLKLLQAEGKKVVITGSFKYSIPKEKGHLPRGFVFKRNQNPIREIGIILPASKDDYSLNYLKNWDGNRPDWKIILDTKGRAEMYKYTHFSAQIGMLLPITRLDSNYVVFTDSNAFDEQNPWLRVLWMGISENGKFEFAENALPPVGYFPHPY